MKTSTVGIVSAAILTVVAGAGFGIARAAVTQSEQQVFRIEDQKVTQVTKSSEEFVPEGNWSGTDWQARVPVAPDTIPMTVFEGSWMKEYGND